MSDDRGVVLVGVGTFPGDEATLRALRSGDLDVNHLDVLVAAATAALVDAAPIAGVAALAAELGTIAVTEGNWSMTNPAGAVADAIGAPLAVCELVGVGVPQSTPVREAAERIAAGDLEAALVLGGEAKASELRHRRAGTDMAEPAVSEVAARAANGEPDRVLRPGGEIVAESEIAVGMWDPVQQYACIDNALAHHEGLTVADQLDHTAELWSRCNAVAVDNALAWFDEPRSAEFLRQPGPDNRPLAFPYAKWHSTQWSVDQGAALLLCSVGAARRMGIDPSRWIHPRVLVDSDHSVSLSKRGELHRWPAMAVLGAAAAEHLGAPLTEIDIVELYSCFPAAVKVQQRELGLDPDATPTVTGGMAFAGGPFNNFTYQATAAVVAVLREHARRGYRGDALVTTVSGLLTKPGLAIWSTEPDRSPLIAQLGDDAAALTTTVESTSDGTGSATVCTATLLYEGSEPVSAFVIADLVDRPGVRWVGTSTDAELLAALTAGELIDSSVEVDGATCVASRPGGR